MILPDFGRVGGLKSSRPARDVAPFAEAAEAEPPSLKLLGPRAFEIDGP